MVVIQKYLFPKEVDLQIFGFFPVCVPLMTFYPFIFWLQEQQLELSHLSASLKVFNSCEGERWFIPLACTTS